MSPTRLLLLCLILAMAATGCAGTGSAPTARRYVLTDPPITTAPPTGTAGLPTVGISPIRMAAFLDTSAMVTMNNNGAVHSAAYHRWADPPRAAVAQVLVADLADLTNGYRFESALSGVTAEWMFRVDIYLERFNAMDIGAVSIAGHWRLVRSKDHKLVAEAPFGIRRPSRSGDYGATADGLRELVGALAGAIAAELPPPPKLTGPD